METKNIFGIEYKVIDFNPGDDIINDWREYLSRMLIMIL